MNYLSFNLGDAFLGSSSFLRDVTDVGKLLSILLNNAITIAGIVLIFIFIIAGIQMISGSGDAQKAAQARQVITAGIIGFILVVAAFFIVRLLESSLGVNLLG